MSINIVRTTIGAAALSLTLTPAWATQPAGHQMAGMAPASGGGAARCAQSSLGVTRAIDDVNGRIEDARQTNDASMLRAAIADLQVVLAQMKTQLADCVALAGEAGGGAMGNIPGLDQSKMQMPQGTPVMQPGSTASAPGAKTAAPMPGMDHSKMPPAPKSAVAPRSGASAGAKAAAPAAGMDHSKMAGAPPAKTNPEASKMAGMDHSKMVGDKAGQAPSVVFTLRTQPAPPRGGKNDFEVTLKDADGKPIADAEVSLEFSMPAMPSMKTQEVRLTPAGNGSYKGSGTIGMAGDWDVTITAARMGQTLATKKMKLTPK